MLIPFLASFRPRLRRRAVLLILPFAATAGLASAQILRQPGITLEARAWNDIRVQDDEGATLVTFGDFATKYITPAANARGGSVREIAAADGVPALEVTYHLADKDAASPLGLVARFTARPGRVDVHYDLSGVPADAKTEKGKPRKDVKGSFVCRLADGAEALPAKELAFWQRHPHGGIPIETPAGKFISYRMGERQVSVALDDGYAPNRRLVLVSLLKQEAPAAGYAADLSILVTPAGWSPELVAARKHGRPLALGIGTDKTFNWWTDTSAPLALKAGLGNATDEARTVTLRHWVRDFSGRFLLDETREVDLQPGQTLEENIRFTPADKRGIYFAEVSALDRKTGTEVFARTNLTLLPPHEFQGTPADSIFGMSAWWPVPTKEDAERVMARMGVRWYRSGNTHADKGVIANHHSGTPTKITDPAEREAWIRQHLQLCVERGNPYWECGNEINYGFIGIAQGDVLKGEERARRAAAYVQSLRDIRRVQKEMGPPASDVKLLSFGLAGMDVKFMEAVHEAGGWDLLDGLALHPGRGNFTADYPVAEPWDTWVFGPNGNYWNYYGSVRTARKLIEKYGGNKELWLTEVYACNYPNSFWEDSLRNGAENLVLSFALAKAEGVKAVLWYQLFDSVWFDQLGVPPVHRSREYYFGLIHRDLGFKPAVLAYCATAEALDQAKFVRWLQFAGHEKTRGLLFDTPRGPMAILWDRSDGYVLKGRAEDYDRTKKKEKREPGTFASPEPWNDTWLTRTSLTLPVKGPGLTAVNVIGQDTFLPAKDATATISLTGAPVIVYGVDPQRMK